jgi:hypothetical protein
MDPLDALAEPLALAERAVNEHFRCLAAGLRAAQQEAASHLNVCFRRMRAYESDRDWCEAALDAAAAFCRRAAFFSIRAGEISFQGARGSGGGAPAFEDSEIATITSDIAESKENAALIPVTAGDRIPGVLYVEGVTDRATLQTIASFAGASLENHLLLEESPRAARIRPAEAHEPRDAAARRFASVAVARIILHEFAAVRHGRQHRSLHASCARSIDNARERYQREFAGLPDYLQQEIVRTLALDRPELLGPGRPVS